MNPASPAFAAMRIHAIAATTTPPTEMLAARPIDQDELGSTLLALLPEDGTPVLNRVLRLSASRQLSCKIDNEAFFAARERLRARGLVGRLRGHGGRTFLLGKSVETPSPVSSLKPRGTWTEANLMSALGAYLNGPFRAGLELPPQGLSLVKDTSTLGPSKGRWVRPDFILVSVMRFRLMPGAEVDVHSFELKTETGGSVLAVHEALAQTRFTHFGHLVWHLPPGSKAEGRLNEVIAQCETHGIGLIRMKDPARPTDEDATEILLDPERKPTPPLDVEDFLASRLDEEQQMAIAKALR